MDKKAVVGLATIMFIIVALISFGSMVGIALKIGESSGRISEGQACRTMLGIQDISKKTTAGFINLKEQCETIKLKKEFGKGDELELAKFLSDKVARSWWIVHEGEIRDMWTVDNFISRGDSSCRIIYSISLEPKKILGKEQAITLTRDQFKNYFYTTVYPVKRKQNLTYFDYLFDTRKVYFDILPSAFPFEDDFSDSTVISNNDIYAIIALSPEQGFWDVSYFTEKADLNDVLILKNPSLSSSSLVDLFSSSMPSTQLYFTTMEMASNKLGCEYI